MRMYFICCTAIISAFVLKHAHAESLSPISPREYYRDLGQGVDSGSLNDFFDIYHEEFSHCVDPDVFYNAKVDLLKLGNKENFVEVVSSLRKCPNIDDELKVAMDNQVKYFNEENAEAAKVALLENKAMANTQEIKPHRAVKSINGVVIPKDKPVMTMQAFDVVSNNHKAAKKDDMETKYYAGIREKYRHRTGDNRSRNRLKSLTTTAFVSIDDNIEFGIAHEYLDAGSFRTGVDMGTYYNFLETGYMNKNSSYRQNVYTPYIRIGSDKNVLILGTTPISAAVSSLPVFAWDWQAESLGWNMSIYHKGREDTLLSKVGMKDPYSNSSWGRAIEAGAKLGYDYSFGKGYFINNSISANHYYGKNLDDNYSFKYNLVAGKSINKFSFGVYSAFEHYKENQDNHSFGHGGYYSPQALVALYPFVSYEHKTEKHLLALDASIGGYYEKKKDVRKYFHTKNGVLSNPSAMGDITSNIKGESNVELGYNIGAKYETYLTDKLKLQFAGRYIGGSTDYSETIFNLGIAREF